MKIKGEKQQPPRVRRRPRIWEPKVHTLRWKQKVPHPPRGVLVGLLLQVVRVRLAWDRALRWGCTPIISSKSLTLLEAQGGPTLSSVLHNNL